MEIPLPSRPVHPALLPLFARWVGALLLFTGSWTLALASVDAGRQIFEGRISLTGRLPGQDTPLPAQAVRCSNCHRSSSPNPGVALSALRQPLGPDLNARTLLEPAARRNGPLSRFDAALMCRALRDGIDPMRIVLAPAMPRYDISDTQCSALWSYLVRQHQ